MLIRKSHKKDVDAIFNIEKVSFDYIAFSRRAVSYHIKNNLVLCAIIDYQIAGYICFSPLTKIKKRRIYSIAVDPSFRKLGVGQILLAEGEKKSRAREIFLEVDVMNSAAISMYRKNGFREFGLYKNYYGKTDAIRMKKIIK
jgi:ribosomal protein S18 acetylase RimI-like enzyme